MYSCIIYVPLYSSSRQPENIDSCTEKEQLYCHPEIILLQAEHESICSFVRIMHTKVKTFGKPQDWIYHLGRSAKHGHRKFCGPHECTPERQALRAQHGMRPIASDGIAWFVCLPSVCLCVCVSWSRMWAVQKWSRSRCCLGYGLVCVQGTMY